MSTTTKEKIIRKREAMARLGVGHTYFEEKFAHRLTKVQLGDRAVGFTDSSVDKLIAELIDASAGAPKYVPPPKRQRAARKQTAYALAIVAGK
jgi:predicted DNA-binding transcriptional regulator AlpA